MKAVLSLLTTSSIICANSKSVEESNTGALLTFPWVADGELYNKSWEVAPAQFGYQRYGGKLEGVLVLPLNTSYHLECDGGEPAGLNPYIHWIQDFFTETDDISDYIMVIDRLDCYFVEKVEVAEALGASAVIICDKRQEHLFTMWMPQDWVDDINIPSVLVQEENCEILYQHLGVRNWDPYNIEQTIYPDEYSINWTVATIEWGLPHDDDRVEWELWTSSNDLMGSEFKHNFNDTAIALDLANDTLFTPHMYILNGSHWGCDDASLPCRKQCTNTGRYCAVDPEYDLTIGLDGMDVIQENLRSLCVWEYDKEHALGSGLVDDDLLWWDYVVLWDENCGILANDTSRFEEACAYEQMDKLNPNLAAAVADCIINSGGYGYEDGVNTILQRETRLRENSSIYALPMVRVNEFLIHGNIDCPPPVTVHSCEVLSAICAGFINGTQPDVCFLTPSPTPVTCTDADKDCNGTCFGSYLTDACDQCLPVTSPLWNECIGCQQLPDDSTYDCEGICGGNHQTNPCGYCIDSTRSDFDSYGIACDGSCSTTMAEDECGNCLDVSSESWNSCVGCDGVANSNHELNDCGVCLSITDDNFADAGKDCRGICFGDYSEDECGECLAPDDDSANACLGCDGVANSDKEYNECGYCVLASSPDFDDYGKDCNGTCPTSVRETHYVDECGNCLLTSDERWNECLSGLTSAPIATNTRVANIQQKENELTTVIVVVCIVAFLIIVAACIIIGALWRKQGQIDDRFNSLAATYQVMDENPQHSIQVGSSKKKNKKGLQTVGDDSGEDE